MNRMTREEFEDRIEAVQEAREIFGELTEGRIDRAFEAYQLILAKRERKLIISILEGNRPPSPLDQFERPKCEDCGADILFRVLAENSEGYRTLLECSNPQCQARWYSEMDINQWVKELQDASRPEQTEKGK